MLWKPTLLCYLVWVWFTLRLQQRHWKGKERRPLTIRDHYWIQVRMASLCLLLLSYRLTLTEPFQVWKLLSNPVWGQTWELIRDLLIGLIVAAVVSAIFDLYYHRQQFGAYVEKIQSSVGDLQRLVGDVTYYESRLQGIRDSRRRVTILDDAWPIDPEWFEGRGIRECRTYQALAAREVKIEVDPWSWECTIAGNVPYPQPCLRTIPKKPDSLWARIMPGMTHDATVELLNDDGGAYPPSGEGQADSDWILELDPAEFLRFIGVIWWLMLAHELSGQFRKTYGERFRREAVRVVVADVPIQGTIIDDTVYVSFREQGTDGRAVARGVEMVKDVPAAAAGFHRMIDRYLLHVRSAREYVLSCLYLSALWKGEGDDTSGLRDVIGELAERLAGLRADGGVDALSRAPGEHPGPDQHPRGPGAVRFQEDIMAHEGAPLAPEARARIVTYWPRIKVLLEDFHDTYIRRQGDLEPQVLQLRVENL